MDLLSALEQKYQIITIGQKDGGEFACPCPYCQDGKDRFHFWPIKNRFWCRQCGKTGDLIQYLRDCEGKSFKQAAELAGKDISNYQSKAMRPVPTIPPTQNSAPDWEPVAPAPVDEKWQTQSQKLADWAAAQLASNPEQLDYLAARGIDAHTAARYHLGWIPSDPKTGHPALYRQRAAWGLPPEIKSNGKPKMLWIPRGLVIPAFDAGGAIHRLRIRRPDQDVAAGPDIRYYVFPGSNAGPLFIDQHARAFVVVEAELDALLLTATGGRLVNVIGLGSSTTRPDADLHKRLLDAHVILVALDADAAGAKAAQWWAEHYPRAKRYPVPQAKDPGDAFAAGVDLRRWIWAGLPPSCRLELSVDMAMVEGGAEISDNPPVTEQPPPAKPAAVATGVQQLYRLVSTNPIRLINTREQTSIRVPYGWKDKGDAVSQTSRLVFFDADVIDFMENHPAERIDRGNFWGAAN